MARWFTGPGTEKRFWLHLLRVGLQGPAQARAWCAFALPASGLR